MLDPEKGRPPGALQLPAGTYSTEKPEAKAAGFTLPGQQRFGVLLQPENHGFHRVHSSPPGQADTVLALGDPVPTAVLEQPYGVAFGIWGAPFPKNLPQYLASAVLQTDFQQPGVLRAMSKRFQQLLLGIGVGAEAQVAEQDAPRT